MARERISEDAVVVRLRAAGCVFAEDEARLLLAAPVGADELEAMVAERVAGVPLEHILGWAEFCDLRVVVERGVFVPRRRTEFLARLAIARARAGMAVVDLCCGSGAVAAALDAAVTGLDLYAVDIDPAAVHCAGRNLGTERALTGDLYDALPPALRGRVDLVVANAPYVPSDEIALMPPEARLFEAAVALDGGPDGVDVQRRVIEGAAVWLRPGGQVLIETSGRQAPLTTAACERAGLDVRVTACEELAGTVVIGTSPAS